MKFINVLMLIVLGCGGPSDKEASESVKKIILNSSQSKLEYDVTPLLEQSVDVIKLETTSDCLVRADGNTFFTKDRIFISDKILKKVFS